MSNLFHLKPRPKVLKHPVGCLWIIPKVDGKHGIALEARRKPSRFRLLAMRLILGWVWEDYLDGEGIS